MAPPRPEIFGNMSPTTRKQARISGPVEMVMNVNEKLSDGPVAKKPRGRRFLYIRPHSLLVL
jgi:hypothetical protein